MYRIARNFHLEKKKKKISPFSLMDKTVAGETFILRTYVNDRAYGDLCHMGENLFH